MKHTDDKTLMEKRWHEEKKKQRQRARKQKNEHKEMFYKENTRNDI